MNVQRRKARARTGTRGSNVSARRGIRQLAQHLLEALESRRMLSVTVLTGHNDPARTGLNSNEVLLNPSNVSASSFGRKASYAVSGQIYAQPLYVSNLTINSVSHNVVFVATQHNDIYAFDVNGGGQLWHRFLGEPAHFPENFFHEHDVPGLVSANRQSAERQRLFPAHLRHQSAQRQ
jgi:hypothetical protein